MFADRIQLREIPIPSTSGGQAEFDSSCVRRCKVIPVSHRILTRVAPLATSPNPKRGPFFETRLVIRNILEPSKREPLGGPRCETSLRFFFSFNLTEKKSFCLSDQVITVSPSWNTYKFLALAQKALSTFDMAKTIVCMYSLLQSGLVSRSPEI